MSILGVIRSLNSFKAMILLAKSISQSNPFQKPTRPFYCIE
jgi:hypothetical protein